jgi:acetyl esterase/lipase
MDITYSRIEGYRPLKLDLYMSKAKAAAPKPLVIWLHGGGWNAGDQRGGAIATPAYRNWPNWLAVLAGRGYVVAGVSYRFSSEAHYPAQIQDVKAAVRWLRANAATYGIDPNRVVVWGASAGGQLAAVLGTSCGVPELEGTPVRGAETSSCVQGVVDFYGPTDFKVEDSQRLPGSMTHDEPTSANSRYLGCAVQSCPPEQLRLENPISFVDKSDPPFLIMQGDADTLVPPKQSQILYDALQKAGVKSELVMVHGVNHIFRGASDAQGKEIYDKVMAFLDATTGVKPAP